MIIYDFIQGDSSEAMLMMSLLHFHRQLDRKLRVADATYGKGVFWQQLDTSEFDFFPSDLITCKNKFDFHDLPYENNFFDIAVLDPHGKFERRYSGYYCPQRWHD